MIFGHSEAVEQFRRAWDSRSIHHAWLVAGPRGVGKAHFAREGATRLLSEAAGPPFDLPGLETPTDHSIRKLIEAGSHPDMRWLERLENAKTGNLARNIGVDQIRGLGEFMGLTAALSAWRAVVIDSVDDLEREGANALLKMLEEPPAHTIFFLVSHVPGRLLPTIRSRCRRLDLRPLDDDAMASALEAVLPDATPAQRQRLVPLSEGSIGRALGFAELDLEPLEKSAGEILRGGDRNNAIRSDLASQLGKKAAADRYSAFLDLVPALIAREARTAPHAKRRRAIQAYERARELIAASSRLDPSATVFQLGGILASVAEPRLP
jgi:DNA polymerase-3 subunit delta'